MISDTGEGIAPDFLPHIFERFRQADTSSKRRHGGLGVGLSIVRSLVEIHGGSVRAVSDGPGKGATFVVAFPIIGLSDADVLGAPEFGSRWKQKTPVGEDDLQPHLLEGIKVLAVDDQQDTRELILLALKRYGAEVRVADSASSALETLTGWKPNVIVSDIGLPEMDGYDFIRALRTKETEGNRIPAIALTGYAGAVDESKALSAGYELHFSKPINLDELALTIAKLSRKSL
ncbi:MAG TPA: response regulator [Pyrinomonadaceae bacterium]|nr:response regulator [Pyrinomonadaceae bacterium]